MSITDNAFYIRDKIRAHAPLPLVLSNIIASYAVSAGDLLMLMPRVFPQGDFNDNSIRTRYDPTRGYYGIFPTPDISLTIHCGMRDPDTWLIQLLHGKYPHWLYISECDGDPFNHLIAQTRYEGGPSKQLLECIDPMRAFLESTIAECGKFMLRA